jgi:uncharacterized protein YkwD
MYRREFIGCAAALGATGMASGALALPWAQGALPLGAAIRLFSEARRAAGLDVPALDAGLAASALRQAAHMAERGAVSHFDAAGLDPNRRARQAGFAGRVLGEALAETRDGPVETMAFWLSHEPTRAVLMDAGARRFGLAGMAGTDGRDWWLMATGA